jgi:hypothetical protein
MRAAHDCGGSIDTPRGDPFRESLCGSRPCPDEASRQWRRSGAVSHTGPCGCPEGVPLGKFLRHLAGSERSERLSGGGGGESEG